MGRLGFGDVLGTTFRLVFRNLPAFAATQGVALLAAVVLGAVIGFTLGVAGAMLVAEGQMGLAYAVFGAELVGMLLVTGILVAGLGLGAHAADAALRGERIRLRDAWELARPRIPNLLATVLLVLLALAGVGLLLGLLVGLLPLEDPAVEFAVAAAVTVAAYALAVLLFAHWVLALPLSMFEGHSPARNLGESSRMTAGARGVLAGLALVLILGYLLGGGLLVLPLALLGVFIGGAAGAVGAGLVAVLVLGVLWLAVATVAMFLWTALAVVAYRRLQPPAATDFEVLPDDEPSFVL